MTKGEKERRGAIATRAELEDELEVKLAELAERRRVLKAILLREFGVDYDKVDFARLKREEKWLLRH